MLDEKKIADLFMQSIHCSQIVVGEFAAQLGFDPEEIMRIAAPFGGGMCRGAACGAVTGALMVIGMKYGHSAPGDVRQNNICVRKAMAFQNAFRKRHQSLECRDLLGCDLAQPGQYEYAVQNGILTGTCPKYVLDAIDILHGLLGE